MGLFIANVDCLPEKVGLILYIKLYNFVA